MKEISHFDGQLFFRVGKLQPVTIDWISSGCVSCLLIQASREDVIEPTTTVAFEMMIYFLSLSL